MQQHLIAVPLPRTWLPESTNTAHVDSTHTHTSNNAGGGTYCRMHYNDIQSGRIPAEVCTKYKKITCRRTCIFTRHHSGSITPSGAHACTNTHALTYTANPLGINFLTQRVCMPGLAGVPVARGAPHAAMLCQQTALMPSICSVTYIKCMLLSLSPQ